MYIYGGRVSFYQWDVNQELVLNSYVQGDTVHFSNGKDDTVYICEPYALNDLYVVNVPNILLQDSGDIYAYHCKPDYTKIKYRFVVSARPKPGDYVYTETEIKTYQALENQIGLLAELKTSNKESLVGAINELYLKVGTSGGGAGITEEMLGESLTLVDGKLEVNTTDAAEADNTLPISSAAVYTSIGNIDALLQTI